ncbi:MAG: hypothetical protein FD149_1775 [Rhodospirillaceae bacterium]|nr:MAG: hypothetical protein FD149_1775 [Rhodospirillaceae bacterium]
MFEVSDDLWKQLEPVLNPFKRTRSVPGVTMHSINETSLGR